MPTPEQIERAIAEMKKLYANYEYFFEQNESPDWIQPLSEKGFFTDPPKPKDENGYRSFPLWPESQYLVRMAGKAPDLVGAILKKLPATENIYVHADLVQAAIALPGPTAVELSAAEAKWIQSHGQLLWLLPDRYADLVVALTNKGETKAAFRLARALLDVLPDPRFADKSNEDFAFLRPHPIGRMDQWEYEQAVKKVRPALQAADSARTMRLFTDLLYDAMRLGEPPSEPEPEKDHSYIWRSAIEDHAQNEPAQEVSDVLIETVRNTAEEIIRADPPKLASVVEELEGRKRFIFTRLSLHLLALFGEHAPDLVKARLGGWELLDEVGLRHEYARLAQSHFKDLGADDQEKLLANLKSPPDMENFRRNFVAMTGRAATDDDVARAKRGWELEKLAIFRGVLPAKWQARYEELTGGGAEPKHPDFPTYHESGWVGPTSPRSAADMAVMPPDELIGYLNNWEAPKGDPFADSYEGLGRQLSAAVAQDPERFAEFAHRFRGLDPTYVRSVLDGFENALRQNKAFPWTHVLELAEYVTAQPIERDEAPEGAALAERDPGWRWARGAVADVLEEGFGRQDAATIPIDLRDSAWRSLRIVTEDPDPTPAHEARYGGSNMDPLTLSLNTTRGKAMQAVIRYALWVRRDDEKNHPERVEHGFDAMPEAREVFEAHLDPAKDPSLAVRAVHGQWFPWLVLIDPKWASAHVEAVFPGDQTELREAAWEAYLTNQPYDNVVTVLEPRYRASIDELPGVAEKTEKRRFIDPAEKLAEHVMILYWRGKLGWDDENSLVARFFEVAPERVRLEALEFIGRSLYNGGALLTEAQANRLRELWHRRFEALKADPDKHRDEAGAFGWWFASKHDALPADWLLDELLKILESGAPIDAPHLVIERLADLAPKWPGKAIHAFHLMIPVQKEPGLLYGWHEQVKRLVSAVLASDDNTAKKEAERTLNELAARGYREFDDLLAETEKQV
jgi:hypothetical protein